VVFPWMTDNSTAKGAHIISAKLEGSAKSMVLTVNELVNVYVKEVTVDKSYIKTGETVTVKGVIVNNGSGDAENVPVTLYDGSTFIGTVMCDVPYQSSTTIQLKWNSTKATSGTHRLNVTAGKSSKSVLVKVGIRTELLTFEFPYIILIVVIFLVFLFIVAPFTIRQKPKNETKKRYK
jgi:hypothetical protein